MRALVVKYGGVPLWAWLGLAGIGGWFLIPRLTAGAPAASAPGAAPVELTTGVMMVGYKPGGGGGFGSGPLAGAGFGYAPSGAPSGPAAAGTPGGAGYDPISNNPAFDPFWGAPVPATGPGSVNAAAQAAYTAAAALPGGIAANPIGFAGGPSPSIGSLRSVLMAPFHPDLKRPPRVAHVVQAVGGPAAHRANVHRVARAAGVHPARLFALNPVHTGFIHVR